MLDSCLSKKRAPVRFSLRAFLPQFLKMETLQYKIVNTNRPSYSQVGDDRLYDGFSFCL